MKEEQRETLKMRRARHEKHTNIIGLVCGLLRRYWRSWEGFHGVLQGSWLRFGAELGGLERILTGSEAFLGFR